MKTWFGRLRVWRRWAVAISVLVVAGPASAQDKQSVLEEILRIDFFDGNINNGITGGRSTAENGAQSLTAGVNWYANSRTRMMFNVSKYWYETQLGTPFSCDQQSCGAANLRGRGNSNWEIQTRLQLWF